MSKGGRKWKLGESMNDVRQLKGGGAFQFYSILQLMAQ